MRHRVTSLTIDRHNEVLRAVLEDFSERRNWIDVSCGVDSDFAKLLIDAHATGKVIEPVTYP